MRNGTVPLQLEQLHSLLVLKKDSLYPCQLSAVHHIALSTRKEYVEVKSL